MQLNRASNFSGPTAWDQSTLAVIHQKITCVNFKLATVKEITRYYYIWEKGLSILCFTASLGTSPICPDLPAFLSSFVMAIYA